MREGDVGMKWLGNEVRFSAFKFEYGKGILMTLIYEKNKFEIWASLPYSILYCATQNRKRLIEILESKASNKCKKDLSMYVGRNTGYINWLIQESYPFPDDIEHWIIPTSNYVLEYLGSSLDVIDPLNKSIIEVDIEKVIEGLELTDMSWEYVKEEYKEFIDSKYLQEISLEKVIYDEGGVSILLNGELRKNKHGKNYKDKILITFNDSIEALRITETGRRLLLDVMFLNTKKYEPERKCFFKVKNSEFIRWLEKEGRVKFKENIFHYCFITSNMIVDAISRHSPKIEKLREYK